VPGKRVGDRGYFISPAVFANVRHEMRISQEEIFGPVVSVIKFRDEADALRIVNGTAYSLAAGAPVGASINPLSGSFNWTAKNVPVPSTNTVVYVVTDDGTPVMSDSRTCRIVVLGPPRIVQVNRSGPNVFLTWTAIPGVRYRVVFKDSLGQPDWNDLAGDVVAASQTATKTVTPGPQQRFYRVQAVE